MSLWGHVGWGLGRRGADCSLSCLGDTGTARRDIAVGLCEVCKSPLTGKNGRVYFLDVLEHSSKPELDLVWQ